MANLIGTGPNQVPVNGSLGSMAFQDTSNYVDVQGAQSGNAGKYITTDGTAASWQVPPAIATFNQTNYGGM